VSVAF
jgi:transposase